MHYQVVKSGERTINDTLDALNRLVNENIHNGWTPLGGVSITNVTVNNELVFTACQAMTKAR